MAGRIVRIVNLWLHEGASAALFEAFEHKAAVVMAAHGGRIERAVRTVGQEKGAPFEVHLVSFPEADAFDSYLKDPRTLALRSEREAVIARTEVVAGLDVGPYGTS